MQVPHLHAIGQSASLQQLQIMQGDEEYQQKMQQSEKAKRRLGFRQARCSGPKSYESNKNIRKKRANCGREASSSEETNGRVNVEEGNSKQNILYDVQTKVIISRQGVEGRENEERGSEERE